MKKILIFITLISLLNISYAQLSFSNQDSSNSNNNLPDISNLEKNPQMKNIVEIIKYNAAISGYAITCKENPEDVLQIKTFLFNQLKPLHLNDNNTQKLNNLFVDYQNKTSKKPMSDVECFNFTQQFSKIISTIKNIQQ